MVNTTFIAMGIAGVATGGLVLGLGGLSLLSGAMHFFFGKPRLKILKSNLGPHGFAFELQWPMGEESSSFDQIKIRFFNPFGQPRQIDILRTFSQFKGAVDLDMGADMGRIFDSKTSGKSTLQIEVGSSTEGVFHQFNMTKKKFMALRTEAKDFVKEESGETKKPLYSQVKRSFVADPLPASPHKVLKLSTNPSFAAELTSGEKSGGPAQENFSVSKVWIDPGCIVCDACEAIYPEVFEVTESTCVIRPDAPLDDGLRIEEAAEACPVEVIKFAKA